MMGRPSKEKGKTGTLEVVLRFMLGVCGALVLFFLAAAVIGILSAEQDLVLREEEPAQLVISGEIQIDGEKKAYEREDLYAHKYLDHLIITGHFNRTIKEGERVILRRTNVTSRIRVNGEPVFEVKKDDRHILKTPGYGWSYFISPEIKMEDLVEIEIMKSYRFNIGSEPAEFLDHMYVGTEDMLLRKLLKDTWPRLLIDCCILVAGILGSILGLAIRILRQKNMGNVLLFSLLTLACGLWFVTGSPVVQLMLNKPLLIYLMDAISQYFITLTALAYARHLVTGIRKKVMTIFEILTLLFISVSIILQMAGIADLYELKPLGVALNLTFLLAIGLLVGYEGIRLGNREADRNLLAGIPLLAGGITEMINFVVGDGYTPSLVFSAGFFLFLLLQLIMFVHRFLANAKLAERAAQIENELTNERISIMLSQIQPHFLYNALTSISMLCELEPQKAKQASIDFSMYLRGNMDALNLKEAIPFQRERNHVENYLALEKIRFEEKLEIIWKIKTDDFLIPALSLQPIVENAVKHGVGKKGEGGCVVIETLENQDFYLIRVSDNGVGFDTKEGELVQGGIYNVRQRLKLISGGSLTIKSSKGIGTEVEMKLPKKGGKQYEDFGSR